MTELNAKIKPVKSSTPSEVPNSADLEVGEIGINTADGLMWTKHTDDSIVQIGGSDDGVASVNGDPGPAVSLGVSDLDDYAELPATDIAYWGWRGGDTGGNEALGVVGLVSVTSSDPADSFHGLVGVNQTDLNGQSQTLCFDALLLLNQSEAFPVAVKVNDVQIGDFTLPVTALSNYNNGRIVFDFSANLAASSVDWLYTLNDGDSLGLTIPGLIYSGTVPTSEGDLLQYVGGMWSPIPVGSAVGADYISLEVLQSVTAASTDFADFQSRIAAL